jgi:propanol-preferring alcohol dehydrogenase
VATWSAALAACAKAESWPSTLIHLDRVPEFDYDSLLWGERQLRSAANMTPPDASDFCISPPNAPRRRSQPSLDQANEA